MCSPACVCCLLQLCFSHFRRQSVLVYTALCQNRWHSPRLKISNIEKKNKKGLRDAHCAHCWCTVLTVRRKIYSGFGFSLKCTVFFLMPKVYCSYAECIWSLEKMLVMLTTAEWAVSSEGFSVLFILVLVLLLLQPCLLFVFYTCAHFSLIVCIFIFDACLPVLGRLLNFLSCFHVFVLPFSSSTSSFKHHRPLSQR